MVEILMIVSQIQSYNVFIISLTNNIAFHHMPLTIMHLDSALLHITNNNEIAKKIKGFTFENFVIFRYILDSNCTKDHPIILQGEI